MKIKALITFAGICTLLAGSTPAKAETADLLERFSFKGDFRLRHESQFNDSGNASGNVDDRHRQRIRLRLGGRFKMHDDLHIGFRLASGSSSPTSTNQTLGDSAGTKDILLDRAYVAWTPENWKIQGGKFSVPFMKSELLWDGDVNLEGASEEYRFKSGDTELILILGAVYRRRKQ